MVPPPNGRIPAAIGGPEQSRLHRWLVAAGLAVGLVALGVALSAAFTFVAAFAFALGTGSVLATTVAVTVAAELGYLALGVGYRELLWDGLGVGRPSARALAGAGAAGLALVALGQGVLRVVPGAGIDDVSTAVLESGLDPAVLLALAVVGVLVVGPAEEALFRAGVQGTLRLAFGAWPSILGASVLFTAVHAPALLGRPPAAVVGVLGVVFAVSVVLGVAYERTDGLAVPAVVHSVYDGALLAVGYLVATGFL